METGTLPSILTCHNFELLGAICDYLGCFVLFFVFLKIFKWSIFVLQGSKHLKLMVTISLFGDVFLIFNCYKVHEDECVHKSVHTWQEVHVSGAGFP